MTEPDTSAPSNHAEEAARMRLANLALSRGQETLRLISLNMPWLSPLASAVTLAVDDRFSVAAVTQTGRILLNPAVFSALPFRDATFILAHELLHLALDTFSRESSFEDPRVVNIAHDYIINDLLRGELWMSPPLDGLELRGAADWSLEQMVAWMNECPSRKGEDCWIPKKYFKGEARPSKSGSLNSALRSAGLLKEEPPLPKIRKPDPRLSGIDVIFPAMERELFPSDFEQAESSKLIESQSVGLIRDAARRSSALKLAEEAITFGHYGGSQNASVYLEALRKHYEPPWQVALQRWMESAMPGQRTYARPSRRGNRDDCVLPGRNREGWTLHIILDTSGSMSDELQMCLGAIADFCEANQVLDIHILQCDMTVTVDEWIPVQELAHYGVYGFGGSDMSPAMLKLASDPDVESIVVITDGGIFFPFQMPGINVLWIVTNAFNFQPPYGTVISLN